MVEAISNMQAAETQSKIQMAVMAKMLQVTRDQGAAVVQLLEDTVENVQESIEALANDLDASQAGRFDTYA